MLDSQVPDQGNGQWAPEFVLHYSAYFHCHRALQLFGTLSDTVRESRDVRTAEGTAWAVAGVILSRSGQEFINSEELPYNRNRQKSLASYVTLVRGGEESPAEPAEPAESADGVWHCSDDTIERVKGTTVTERSFTRSPYSSDAVIYYQRAGMLLPDDSFVRCNWADAAFVLGDDRPMQELNASSSAHEFLAEALIGGSPQWNAERAQLALDEFAKAFALDPQNLWARNSYSYKVWTWYLEAARERGPGLPRSLVQQAEKHARDAARLAASTGRKSDAAAMRSTLGETLLMQGRPHEAYRELEQALELAPEHPFFDEIRWELAVAYLCAGAVDRRPGRSTRPEMDFEAKAAQLLTKIRDANEAREGHSLTYLQPFESHRILELCASGPGGEPSKPDNMPYKLDSGSPHLGSYSPCGYLAVGAHVKVEESEEARSLRLRVFGPGMESTRPVRFGTGLSYQPLVTLPRADSHDLYFAQLERIDEKAWVPVSIAYPIETREHEPCSSNSIVLEFSPHIAKPPSAVSDERKPSGETEVRKTTRLGSPGALLPG